MPDVNSPPNTSDPSRQALEKQYAQAMRQALQDFHYLGFIPDQADPQSLAAAVREIVSRLENMTNREVSMRLPPDAAERELRSIRADNQALVERNKQLFNQVKALSAVVTRLQDRLDQGKNGGQKGL